MNGTFDPALVILSYIIAALASYAALSLASHQRSSSAALRHYWLIGGATAMGLGIWSMHFVGMLAFHMPIETNYDLKDTALSLLIAVAVSGFALNTVNRDHLSVKRLTFSAATAGAGIAGMHYTGMAALQVFPGIRYEPSIVAISLLVAVGAAFGALKIAFSLRQFSTASHQLPRVGGALLMGLAICGMHYTGMAAAHFSSGTICTGSPSHISNSVLAGSVGLFTFALLSLVMLIDPRRSIASTSVRSLKSIRFKLASSYLLIAALVLCSGALTLAVEMQGAKRTAMLQAESAATLILSAFGDDATGHPAQLQVIMDRFRAAQSIEVAVVDQDALIVADTDPVAVGARMVGPGLGIVKSALRSGESGSFINQGSTQETIRRVVIPIRRTAGNSDTDIVGALVMEYTPIYATLIDEARRTGSLIIAVGGLFVLLISVLGIHMAGSVSKPLVEFELGSAELAAGRYETRVPVRTNDEIGRLAVAFNFLAQELQTSHDRISQHRSDLERTVAERTEEWRRAEEAQRAVAAELRLITEHMPAALCYVDKDMRYRFHNPRFATKFHVADDMIDGHTVEEVVGHDTFATIQPHLKRALSGHEVSYERPVVNRGHNEFQEVMTTLVPRFGEDSAVTGYYAMSLDISERKRAERRLHGAVNELREANLRLRETQGQLLHAEKMASVGQLAAGVAHEINNPIGYVQSNLGTLRHYLDGVFSLIDRYEEATGAIADPLVIASLKVARSAADIDFVREDLNALFAETKEGIVRVTKIVRDLKNFSHAGSGEAWETANLQDGLESTLGIVWNEVKYRAEVVKEYGDLPPVLCRPSQINQVFMNMLVNAAQAIKERGIIFIRTGTQGDMVWIEFEDTGEGIKPENLKRIFDPFFTTKPVGKGTGLGLALSYGIVETHGGHIEAKSVVGVGTTFRIWLPIHQASEQAVVATNNDTAKPVSPGSDSSADSINSELVAASFGNNALMRTNWIDSEIDDEKEVK
jgi:PAS domain S-box-containing protein